MLNFELYKLLNMSSSVMLSLCIYFDLVWFKITFNIQNLPLDNLYYYKMNKNFIKLGVYSIVTKDNLQKV